MRELREFKGTPEELFALIELDPARPVLELSDALVRSLCSEGKLRAWIGIDGFVQFADGTWRPNRRSDPASRKGTDDRMKRDKWIAYLRSNDPEARDLLQRHPGMKPSENDFDLKTRWKDPEFRARNAAAVRETLSPWKDPGFRARNAAAVRETLKARWKDPGFRARNAAAVRETLKARWKDPGFRVRNAAAVRENWKAPVAGRNAARSGRHSEAPGSGSECGCGPGELEGPRVPGSACGCGPGDAEGPVEGPRARHAAAVRENWKDRFRAACARSGNWTAPGARHAAAVRENWKDPGFRARHAAAASAAQRRRWKRDRQEGSG